MEQPLGALGGLRALGALGGLGGLRALGGLGGLRALGGLGALVLLAFCNGANSADDFCLNKTCPEYTVVEANEDFEVRRYAASEWITTRIDADGTQDVMAANSRLKNAGYQFHSAAWPALITHTEDKDGPQWFLSWFVPPDTTKPESSDPSVTLQNKPAATVYVKVFDGTPSRERGLENAKLLRNALKKAGKSFDPSTYVGAGYEGYFSLFHHNEIWIYAE